MNQLKTAVLIRNQFEAEHIQKNVSGKLIYLCPNQDLFAYCQQFNLDAICLSEDLLEGSEAEINEWGYRLACAHIPTLQKNDSFQNIFLNINFYTIKGIFTQGIKFLTVIEKLHKKYHFEEFVCFKSPNSLLVNTCLEYFKTIPGLIISELLNLALLKKERCRLGIKEYLRQFLAFISNIQADLMIFILGARKKKFFFFSGALNHLDSVVQILNEKHLYNLVCVEAEFNLKKYIACLKRFIPYKVLSMTAKPCKNAELISDFFKNGQEIIFKNENYTKLFSKIVTPSFESSLLKFPIPYQILERLYDQLKPCGVLLDEDLSLFRRSLAVFSWMQKGESFVVSHGIPVQKLSNASPKNQLFKSSIIFVNSQFEKSVYQNLFFEPARILSLGIPRYDKIFQLKSNRTTNKSKKVILLCLSGFHNYDFEAFMPVLVKADSIQTRNAAYIHDILKILSGKKDVVVKIKTHFINEYNLVKRYVQNLNIKTEYSVLRHDAPIFNLENEADIIVAPESTVINEAIMLQKPVILMNYNSSFKVTEYIDSGLVSYANCYNELEKILDYIFDSAWQRNKYLPNHKAHSSLFYKFEDSSNSKRVADYIIQNTITL